MRPQSPTTTTRASSASLRTPCIAPLSRPPTGPPARWPSVLAGRHTTVQRIWHAQKLKPHLMHTFKRSNDKRFVEKLRDVIGLYVNRARSTRRGVELCRMRNHKSQALDRSKPGLPMKKVARAP